MLVIQNNDIIDILYIIVARRTKTLPPRGLGFWHYVRGSHEYVSHKLVPISVLFYLSNGQYYADGGTLSPAEISLALYSQYVDGS